VYSGLEAEQLIRSSARIVGPLECDPKQTRNSYRRRQGVLNELSLVDEPSRFSIDESDEEEDESEREEDEEVALLTVSPSYHSDDDEHEDLSSRADHGE